MTAYLWTAFALGLFSTVLRLAEMADGEWPKQRKPKTLGRHCAETILGIAFLVWVSILLFWA